MRDGMKLANLCVLVLFVTAVFAQDEPASAPPEPPRPCVESAKHAEFDFWVGEWEVFMADDRKAGENSVRKLDGDCLVQEKWTSVMGSTGTSMNYFDPGSGKWIQNWVGAGGTFITIRGGLEESSMVLEGEITYASNSVTNAFRGTWTPLDDGSVRQYFQESTDNGVTWNDWFEGFYRKKSADD